MLEFLDPEDRYAVKGTRLVVEASRLPAPVKEPFREWVLMGLLMRGRDALSDYFFDVLRSNGLEGDDIDNEPLVFGTFLASEFYRFLRTDEGAPYAAAFLPPAKPAAAEPMQPQPRSPSPIGPSLPPKLVASLREAGEPLSEWEDAESGAWDRPDPEPAPSSVVGTPDVAAPTAEAVLAGSSFPVFGEPAPRHAGSTKERIVEGVDWGDPRGRFRRATWVALCSGDFPGIPRGVKMRFQRQPVWKVIQAQPPRPPPAPNLALRAAAGYPGVGEGSGGAVGDGSGGADGPVGLAALVADEHRAAAFEELGLTPRLKDAVAWIAADDARRYTGTVKVFASFRGTGKGPYPDQWYVRRGGNGAMPVSSLMGSWRGQDAPLDFRMRHGF